MECHWDYGKIRTMLAGRQLPAMLVNLDCLDHNISVFRGLAEASGKQVRIASKSIRVPALLKYILGKGEGQFRGLMCYSVREAAFLFEQGFDDLLVAYPTASEDDIRLYFEIREAGADASLMVDSPEHIRMISEILDAANRDMPPARLCIDVDMSFRPMGQHLGVYRSPVLTPHDFEELVDLIQAEPRLELTGVMGYEAQVAGMGDRNPFSPLMNPAKGLIRKLSQKDVAAKRAKIQEILDRRKASISYFNGGGTGSFSSTSRESCVTEVTVGSGFLQSHLFDYYSANRCLPALAFALQVDRQPARDVFTCKSGGFLASGEVGPDKAPLPFLPEGLKMIPREGAGEVQTPVRTSGDLKLKLGDPVLFRPAKAGEIAEHFRHYHLFRDDSIQETVPTYRGGDLAFY